MSKAKTTKTKTKTPKSQTPETNPQPNPKITPKTYERLKRFVIRTERDNFDSIYVIPCAGDKGWHEVGDHSALFYYYHALKHREKKPKFKYDTFSGYYSHYEFGRISVRQIDDVLRALKTAGYDTLKITHLDATGRPTTSQIHVTRIQLGTTYTDGEVHALQRQEEKRREKSLRVPRANDAMPELYLDITHFANTLHHLCNRNFDKFARTGIANTMLSQCDELLRTYLESLTILSVVGDNERTNPALYFKGLRKVIAKHEHINSLIDDLNISIQMVYTYQYLDVTNCCVAQSQLFSIKEQIIKSIKTLKKKEQNYEKVQENQ